ncbi:MAG: 3-phosphoglycerate dehydrogenase, partial [Clostridia bacterium]|nr:3-phosphoglycerate dehydrogenase [Clostridia bacterium]
MKNILCLNKIAAVGTDKLDKNLYNVGTDVENPDAIMVRSAAMHDMTFAPEMLAIARAGAGVNNIPVDRCSKEGIVVFNTPGANANGVKELAICALMLASRNVIGGIKWVDTLVGTEGVAKAVEAGKSKFAGVEVMGKKLGVIGLGAIGGMVANSAVHLGMSVLGCDPYISVDAAWNINHHVNKAASFEEIFKEADYISLHVPATPSTKNMINAETIATMKDGVRIINLSRADLVNAADMKAALASGKVAAYVTDFPTDEMVGVEGAVIIPHLGASTAESEDNCAV